MSNKKSGCGCGTMILIIVLSFVGIGVFVAIDEHTPRQNTSVDRSSPEFDRDLLNLKIAQAVRKLNLKDSASYKEMSTREYPYRGGKFYLHQYRAKNSTGAFVVGCFGLEKSKDGKWTFYDESSCGQVADEIKAEIEK